MSSSDNSAFQLEIRDDKVAVLTFDLPGSRANTLGQAVQDELETIVADLQKRGELQGLILRSGKPGMFIAGADLRELGAAKPDAEQTRSMVRRMLVIIAAFENLPYPTVAAIEGACMGGGLELAMGFDFRIASTHPKSDIGLPETKVGLLPGWGGTQRLPRLIGPSLAAEMICSGETAKWERAKQIGLVFDAVPSERLMDESVQLLQWARESGSWKEERRKKQQPIGLTELQAGFTFAVARAQVLAKTKGHFPGPTAALDAIEKGCNLPLEEGLKVETEQVVKVFASPTARNLIALFFMNQRLQKDTGVADKAVTPRPVEMAGVLGAGIMGAGIAGAMVRRGVPVMMLDVNAEALQKGVGAIAKVVESRIKIGRAKPEDVASALGLLSTTTDVRGMADRDVVIEAVIENEGIKVATYQKLQDVLADDAILASNTSTISITRMAESVKNPQRFAGMHYFNPVDRMQLVEVIRGAKTSDQTVVTLVALAKRIGKTPIVVNDCPGFLVNRILFPYLNESMLLLEEGLPPRMLDKVALKFGMPMGPVTLQDVVGIDTSVYAGKVVHDAFADRAVKTTILEELAKEGRLGQKSGAGFYSYAKGPKGVDDPTLEPILQRCRRATRKHSEEEITDRLFLPMLTEASRILTEEIVRDPADVDLGLVYGIGFPAFRGGLLRWADDLGIGNVVAKLEQYQSLGPRFTPTEQMSQLASAGKGFYD